MLFYNLLAFNLRDANYEQKNLSLNSGRRNSRCIIESGISKKYSYGTVLVFHAISTLSSFKQYLSPYEAGNLLFFTAWTMLAACIALFLLKDQDVRLSCGNKVKNRSFYEDLK